MADEVVEEGREVLAFALEGEGNLKHGLVFCHKSDNYNRWLPS